MSETAEYSHDDHAHAVPLWLLGVVFIALLILTILTVAVSEADLANTPIGNIALPSAILPAVIKGTLVCLFFMHLWWDSTFNLVAIISSFVFLGLFLSLMVLDSSEYKQNQIDFNRQHPAIEMRKPGSTPRPVIKHDHEHHEDST